MKKDHLAAGDVLPINIGLLSHNHRAMFVFQDDGNLVLYWQIRWRKWAARWASRTQGSGATTCIMQPDGNLVVYRDKHPLWDSKTWRHHGAGLWLQDDGNAVIYAGGAGVNPVWATHTVTAFSPFHDQGLNGPDPETRQPPNDRIELEPDEHGHSRILYITSDFPQQQVP